MKRFLDGISFDGTGSILSRLAALTESTAAQKNA
jgi:hypothetical protein